MEIKLLQNCFKLSANAKLCNCYRLSTIIDASKVRTHRMLVGHHPFVSMCSFVRVRCWLWKISRVVCNISLWTFMSIFKTILTKYYWSAIFRKFQSTFSTVFLTRIIGWIIVKSEFRMNFSVKMSVSTETEKMNSTDLKIATKLITGNYHLTKYFL